MPLPFAAAVVSLATACSSTSEGGAPTDASISASTGGVSGSSATGGRSNAGASNGGAMTGGTTSGGRSNGGASNGGASSGGAAGSTGTGGGSTSAEAGVDARADGPVPPADPCATALFCETFEGHATGSPPGGDWNDSTNHGTVSVVSTEHFGGQKSAMFATEANSGSKRAFIRLQSAPVFPVPGNAYFGRMMTRHESAPDQSVHWTFIQGGGLVPGETYHSLYRYGGQHPVTQAGNFVGTQLMANYETPDSYSGNGPRSDCWDHADRVVLPTGTWSCVEWQFDGPNDTMRFWLDGAAVDSITVQGTGEGCVSPPSDQTWRAPTFDTLELGWESYQGDSARTLYIDDVVLSTQRVGCPAAP